MSQQEDKIKKDLELIKNATKELNFVKYSDGTEYVRMPNGTLIRSSKRSFRIRKNKD